MVDALRLSTLRKSVPARQSAEDSTRSTARRFNAAGAVLRKSYKY